MEKPQDAQKDARDSDERPDGTTTGDSLRVQRFVIVSLVVCAAVTLTVVAAVIFVRMPERAPAPRPTPAPPQPAPPAPMLPWTPPSAPLLGPGDTGNSRAVVKALEKEALDAIDHLIRALPGSSDPLALMGTVHVQFGNTAEGVRWWDRCLMLTPNRPDVCDGLAQIAEAKGNYPVAAELWRKVLSVNPRLPRIRNKLAGVLIDSGDMTGAIEVLKDELALPAGERYLAHFLLGKVYLQLRQYEKARDAYKASVATKADYPSAWFGLATALARLGKAEPSRQAMQKYHEVVAGLRGPLEEMRTGRMAGRGEDTSERRAREELAAVRRLTALAHTSVGMTYRTKGLRHMAKPHWERAAELDPRDAQCRLELAALYREGGELQKAAEVFAYLAKTHPKNALFHSNLAVIYVELNRLDDALEAIQRALALSPQSPVPAQVYRKIQMRRQREGKQ